MKLNKAIEKRWSPVSFKETPVNDEMIELLFKAAGKAPSSRNEQPWIYYYVRHENKEQYQKVIEMLTGNNPLWAPEAPVLIISVMKKFYEYKNKPNGKALHDTGAANALLGVQAAEMGLQVHPMGGFDKEKISNYLKLDPERYEPVLVIAVGFPNMKKPYSERTEKRLKQHQTRKNINEFVFKL